VTEQRLTHSGAGVSTLQGAVVDVDYDRDVIEVRLDDGSERSFQFELFDSGDVYQPGQRFLLTVDEQGEALEVSVSGPIPGAYTSVSGYVESVDQDDELAWVYLRGEEGWRRKVMPLQLFREHGLDRPGRHFLLDMDEAGTPVALHDDEEELEMQPLAVEETKPRWTNRPAAEAEPRD